MNNLPLCISTTNIDMYADDSTVHASGKTMSKISGKLKDDIDAVASWCDQNRMVLNTQKTKSILITTKQRRHHLENDHLKVSVCGDMLEQVCQDKLLGVIVDNH